MLEWEAAMLEWEAAMLDLAAILAGDRSTMELELVPMVEAMWVCPVVGLAAE